MPLSLASLGCATLAEGVIISDSFTGGVNATFWDGPPTLENDATIAPANNRLEFTAGPAAGLVDGNHFANYFATNSLSGNQSWSVSVVTFLAPVNDFGTFGPNEAAGLTLSVQNSNNTQDNLEVTLAAGDPFGSGTSDVQIRAGLKNDGTDEAPLVSGLLGSIGATDLKLNHDHTTGLVTISYNSGSGDVILGSHDISGWDFDSSKNLTLGLGGGAFSTDTTIQSGTFEVASGEAYFDDLVVNTNTNIPEPSVIALGGLGLMALLRRKRS